MKQYELNPWSPAVAPPNAVKSPGSSPDRRAARSRVTAPVLLTVRYMLAAVLGLGLVLLSSIGLETPATAILVQATTLASGFVLLALAVDNSRARAGYLFISGLAVISLALLSRAFAVELVFMAAPIVALWLAVWLVKSGR